MSRRGIWHPWRHLRHRFPNWTVRFADLGEDTYGETHFATREIVLDRSLNQVERRCTLTHEIVHLHRGPLVDDDYLAAREESVVEHLAARRLVPLEDLVDALLWSGHAAEVIDTLWVDETTLRTRLAGLRDDERAVIDARLRGAPQWMP